MSVYYTSIDSNNNGQIFRWSNGDEEPTQLSFSDQPQVGGVLATQNPENSETSLIYIEPDLIGFTQPDGPFDIVVSSESDISGTKVKVPFDQGGSEGPRWIPGELAVLTVSFRRGD